jgi:hypothetical protein
VGGRGRIGVLAGTLLLNALEVKPLSVARGFWRKGLRDPVNASLERILAFGVEQAVGTPTFTPRNRRPLRRRKLFAG